VKTALGALGIATLLGSMSCSSGPPPPPGGWMSAGGHERYGLTVRPAASEDLTPRLIGRTPPGALAPVTPGPGQISPAIPPAAPRRPKWTDEWVIERPGWIREKAPDGARTSPAFVFVFRKSDADTPGPEPMEILPNSFLDEMERIAAEQSPARAIFHISAEVTRYRGQKYLLIRKALWQRPEDR